LFRILFCSFFLTHLYSTQEDKREEKRFIFIFIRVLCLSLKELAFQKYAYFIHKVMLLHHAKSKENKVWQMLTLQIFLRIWFHLMNILFWKFTSLQILESIFNIILPQACHMAIVVHVYSSSIFEILNDWRDIKGNLEA